MGCVYSKTKRQKPSLSSYSDVPDDLSSHDGNGSRKIGYKIWDSGELRVLPAAAKVSESGSIKGRASIPGLERAVEVLDALGSSMTNLNGHGGFAAGVVTRGNKISILAFEVANTIAKGAKLWRSLSDENIKLMKENIVQSEGLRKLVCSDADQLLAIAAMDKREELGFFTKEVVRFGNLCKDPVWHNLGRYFQKLSLDLTLQEQTKAEIEAIIQDLINLAQNTSELYHELHALDRLEQDHKRKQQEEESSPAVRRENLLILSSELKRQKKLVKNLKKKSLWSRNLEEVVEKLVDIAAFLDKQIFDSFSNTGSNLFKEEQIENQRLGALGLALHYANLINQIDNVASRPLSVPTTTKDSLYHGLPPRVKAALRSRLQLFDPKEEYTVSQINTEMQKTLRWIVPMAENTLRAHQGFGWVGEWANMSTEVNRKPDKQESVTRYLTLHHADKQKTDEHILELIVWLHHLVIQVKNSGYGFKFVTAVENPSQIRIANEDSIKEPAKMTNDREDNFRNISEEDVQMLELVSSRNIIFRRSKSLDFETQRAKWVGTNSGLSKSAGNSPDKEFGVALDLPFERTRVLDVMDGLDTLEKLPFVRSVHSFSL